MAYIALYRSYRPTTFKEVIGQKHVVQTLKNAVMENKTSHAYIFSGLRGIGKTTVARIFAKAVNCESPIDGEPCNQCKNCLAIMQNETTDIIELDAASNNGVDQIREILEKVNFLPSFLRKKVYIIDEAHMLSTAAFNALLKTLEEPPAHVIFILATTEPYKIPATILSRCQRFDFKPFTLEELKEEISYIASKENISINEETISAIAEAADGGMRDAISILDQANVFSTKEITVDDVNSITGRISNYKLIELIDALYSKNASTSIQLINELIDMGKEVNRLISGMIQFCRDLLLYKNINMATSYKYIYNNEDFKNLADKLSPRELFYYIDVLMDVQNKIRFTNSPKIYLEVGVMKIINSASEDLDILNKIHKLEDVVLSSNKTSDTITDTQELDNKLNNMDSRIKKITTDLENAKIDEFKEKIEAKLELLEDVSSKNAALPTDLVFRLDDIEDKIRILNAMNKEKDDQAINELKEQFTLLKNKIDETNQEEKNVVLKNVDNTNIQEQIQALEDKINIIETSIYVSLKEKIQNLEETIQELPKSATFDDSSKLALLKDIEELKQNYALLYTTIQNQQVKSISQMSDELGFDVEDNTNIDIEQMVQELVANVNRISDKIQENANHMKDMDIRLEEIRQTNKSQDEMIDQALTKIEQMRLNNKNNIYDQKFEEVEGRLESLKNADILLKDDLSKVKQIVKTTEVKSIKESINETQKTTILPNIVKKEEQTKPYIPPKEEPKVIKTNANNTLQEIQNVYDIRIVERILHEARERECREEKMRLTTLWSKLQDKVGFALSQVAKMLSDGQMVANGKKEILIVFPTATICNHLMEPKNYVDAKQVLRITLGKEYDFLALPENTWQEKRSEYVGQYSIGIQYPKLSPIKNPELNVITVNYNNQTNNAHKKPLQQARAFFGSALVEEEDK